MDDDPGGRVSVILQGATTSEIAALIAEAHGLSKREREITRLVLHGFSTREIADDFRISPYTVQDHLKAIFQKVGVGSRRELVAQLFLQHYALGSSVEPTSVRTVGSPKSRFQWPRATAAHRRPGLIKFSSQGCG